MSEGTQDNQKAGHRTDLGSSFRGTGSQPPRAPEPAPPRPYRPLPPPSQTAQGSPTTPPVSNAGLRSRPTDLVVERSWTRTTEGLRARDHQALGTALLGGDTPRWRGTPGTPVSGVWRLVTGHFVRRRAALDGAWWQIDTGAGFTGRDRLTLLRIDSDPMVTTTLGVAAPERQPRRADAKS